MWLSEEWIQRHNLCRERRLLMQGAPHHQGSRGLPEYKEVWVSHYTFSYFQTQSSAFLTNHCILSLCLQSSSHEDQECNDFQAYCMAHKGRATSDVSYNPADPLEAYSNPSVHTRITEYTEMGKALHGDTWDPATQPLSGEAIMRAGGGKKHGRYWIANSLVDTASTPTLSQLRARTTDSTPPIRPRPETSVASVRAIQVISAPFVVRCF